MSEAQLATKIDKRVKDAVSAICEQRGWKINRFIEEAILDKLEELDDVADVKALRKEPSRPLSDVIRDLQANGKL